MDPSLSYKYWWNGLNRHSTNITHVKIAHRVVKYNTAGSNGRENMYDTIRYEMLL